MMSDAPRVLLVDDDPAIRDIVALTLKRAGMAVTLAQNGEEGLAALRQAPPDLVLCDWMMPGLDGVALCRLAKADPALAGVFFVLLTSRDETEDKISALGAGADDYLTKPFKPPELVAKVRASLRIKRLQDALADRNRELEALNATKDEFLGIAAHDLRNPLSVLRLWTESIADGHMGPVTPKQGEALGVIQRHVDAMLRLVNDLLDIAKIEQGKVVLRPAPEDPAALLASYVATNALLAERKGVTLSASPDPDLPRVLVDRQKLAEILDNLVSNALKGCGKGASVVLRAVREGDAVLVSVSDTGRGIPPEDLPRLFERFQRPAKGTPVAERGSGLGLAIVRKLVELHGGGVRAESVLGKGTTVSFTLPVA